MEPCERRVQDGAGLVRQGIRSGQGEPFLSGRLLKSGKEVTLTPGQTFYEGPNDIHTVGRNASQTQPAKFIVLLLKDKGAPVLVPEK
ncbi:hypothetical protein P3T21_004939 [Paraburkholderia sp. GAS334]